MIACDAGAEPELRAAVLLSDRRPAEQGAMRLCGVCLPLRVRVLLALVPPMGQGCRATIDSGALVAYTCARQLPPPCSLFFLAYIATAKPRSHWAHLPELSCPTCAAEGLLDGHWGCVTKRLTGRR
jgi:hypothetical protein